MIGSKYPDRSLACYIETLDYHDKTAPLAAAVNRLVTAARKLIADGFNGNDVTVAKEFIAAVEAAEKYK